MERAGLRPLLLSAVLGVGSGAAHGQSLTLTAAPMQGHYHSTERLANGSVADEENGRLRGGEVQAGLGSGPHEWLLRAVQLSGTVAYEGSTQIGLPVDSSTDLRWTDLSLGYRWTRPGDGPWRFRAEAAFGERRIRRAIAATIFSTPLTETLRIDYANLGIRGSFVASPQWRIDAGVSYERALRSRLAVDFHGFADAVGVSPSHREGYAFSLGAEYAPASWCSLGLVWREQRTRDGSSGSVPYTRSGLAAGTVMYPGSQQSLGALALEASFRWL